MNKIFRKYTFSSEAAAKAAIAALGQDEEGNPKHSHQIAELGHIVLTPAELDEDGEVVTEAILSEEYCVDVLWSGEAVAEWDEHIVWTKPFGALVMGASGVRREWLEQCKIERPELFPEPTEEIE